MAPRATVKVWDEGQLIEIEIAKAVNYETAADGRYAEVISTEGGRFLVSTHRVMIQA